MTPSFTRDVCRCPQCESNTRWQWLDTRPSQWFADHPGWLEYTPEELAALEANDPDNDTGF